MVTYAEFTEKSLVEMNEQDFNKIESRVVFLFSAMCKDKWKEDDDTCKNTVILQIEFIQLNGGVSSWVSGSKGKVASHSYSIGGESESLSYDTSEKASGEVTYNNMAISPQALLLLKNGGFYSEIKGVYVCR